MLTLVLSCYVLEIPNDVYTTLSVNSGWLCNIQSRVLQADWLLENNEKATLNVNMPYRDLILRNS